LLIFLEFLLEPALRSALAQILRPDSSAVSIDENSSNEEVSNVQEASTALALPFAFGSAGQAQLPAGGGPTQGQLPLKKPNIIFIIGDDVGWFNIGAYHNREPLLTY
jgi:hypothetical protein